MEKYLARYAEPEAARVVAAVRRASSPYAAALVVPVHREKPRFLDGYRRAAAALASSTGKVLLVVIVNGRDDADDVVNQELLAELHREPSRALSPAGDGFLARGAELDVLCVDRSSPGVRFGPKQGVGLARKIGCDIVALLWKRGDVAARYIASSDADATLPRDYFARAAEQFEDPKVAAAVMPFVHTASGDTRLDAATESYELWFRYYVSGLAWAGSPYAYPALGSTLLIRTSSYLSVRGFSQRLAGEDYYMLDKLAKVGHIAQPGGPPVRLAARQSDRVPFGTGPQVARILADGDEVLRYYPPAAFVALRVVLRLFAEFAVHRSVSRLRQELVRQGPGGSEAALGSLGVFGFLANATTSATAREALLDRTLTWFDGIRTLRFLNALRNELPEISRDVALRTAPFAGTPLLGEGPVNVTRVLVRQRDRSPPRRVGVQVAREILLASSAALAVPECGPDGASETPGGDVRRSWGRGARG